MCGLLGLFFRVSFVNPPRKLERRRGSSRQSGEASSPDSAARSCAHGRRERPSRPGGPVSRRGDGHDTGPSALQLTAHGSRTGWRRSDARWRVRSLPQMLEALVSAWAWGAWGGEHRECAVVAAPEEADTYALYEAGAEASALPVAVAHESNPVGASILVSDETAEDGARVRRMRFFHAPPGGAGDPSGRDRSCVGDPVALVSSIIQTEMLLRGDGTVEPTCLRSRWHALMVAALACTGSPRRVLVLGHGGGALSSFLRQALGCEVTAVDFSAAVASLARAHFGDGAQVHVCDAASYVKRSASSREWDTVFVDLNGSREAALAAPPASMYTAEAVRDLASCAPVVITNVLPAHHSRAEDLQRVRDGFHAQFSTVRWLRSTACDNRVLVAARAPALESPHAALESWLTQQPR